MPSEFNPPKSDSYRKFVQAVQEKLPRKVVESRQYAARQYLDNKKTQLGYQPVCVYQIKDLWTYTHISPPGALVPLEELPVRFQAKLAVLMTVKPFLLIPGVGMRLDADKLNQGYNYWLELHEPESDWNKKEK